jgi:hypothetical protein
MVAPNTYSLIMYLASFGMSLCVTYGFWVVLRSRMLLRELSLVRLSAIKELKASGRSKEQVLAMDEFMQSCAMELSEKTLAEAVYAFIKSHAEATEPARPIDEVILLRAITKMAARAHMMLLTGSLLARILETTVKILSGVSTKKAIERREGHIFRSTHHAHLVI